MINLENSDNFKSWDEWERMKKAHYGTKTGFQMIGGIIDFDPDKQKDLVGGDKLTYATLMKFSTMSLRSSAMNVSVTTGSSTLREHGRSAVRKLIAG